MLSSAARMYDEMNMFSHESIKNIKKNIACILAKVRQNRAEKRVRYLYEKRRLTLYICEENSMLEVLNSKILEFQEVSGELTIKENPLVVATIYANNTPYVYSKSC